MDKRFTDSDTKGLELLVPQLMITQSMAFETAYSDVPESMTELLCKVQQADTFSKERCEELQNLAAKDHGDEDEETEDLPWSIG